MSEQQPRWRKILEQNKPPEQPRWKQILEQARVDSEARADAEEVAAINAAWGCQDTARADADVNHDSPQKN